MIQMGSTLMVTMVLYDVGLTVYKPIHRQRIEFAPIILEPTVFNSVPLLYLVTVKRGRGLRWYVMMLPEMCTSSNKGQEVALHLCQVI